MDIGLLRQTLFERLAEIELLTEGNLDVLAKRFGVTAVEGQAAMFDRCQLGRQCARLPNGLQTTNGKPVGSKKSRTCFIRPSISHPDRPDICCGFISR